MKNLILASKSPRRHEILSLSKIDHMVIVPEADESVVKFVGYPEEYVKALSKLKSDALSKMLQTDEYRSKIDFTNTVTVSADTIVFHDGEVLGKPKDSSDAFRMLKQLSGNVHEVWTSVCLRDLSDGEVVLFAEKTGVRFRELDEREIYSYIESEKPFDKAGAYGIQESACIFVSGIDGDYYNVMGLPVCRLYCELKKLSEK